MRGGRPGPATASDGGCRTKAALVRCIDQSWDNGCQNLVTGPFSWDDAIDHEKSGGLVPPFPTQAVCASLRDILDEKQHSRGRASALLL